MRGYRGFFREMGRTGSWGALALQIRTGALHVLRQLAGRGSEPDPVARFLAHYGEDGIRAPDPGAAELARLAEACRVCGLCTFECSRVGGNPEIDPRDAVVAASRLEIDWQRLGLPVSAGGACDGCDACSQVCPAGIPIHRIQDRLARVATRAGED